MTADRRAIVLGPREGKKLSMMGVELTYKAVGSETGGAYFCMEDQVPVGWAGPPKHFHNKMEEVFYVLEGEITMYVGDKEIRGTPGSFFQIPRGTAHTFANFGTVPAKYLILILPAGFETYFEELPEVVAKHGYPPPPEIMAELGRKYDFENVGPRPSQGEHSPS